ncbi:MAG: ABC transporter permease, partial [Chloroflexota bacterium]
MSVAINPVLVQEMRMRMRGGQAYLLLMTIILVFGGVCLATFWAITNLLRPSAPFTVPLVETPTLQAPPLDRILVAQRGVIFFLIMSLLAVILAALIVPGTTSGTIAGERQINSLPLLVGTPLSALSVVVGKLFGAASYILLVIAAGIPLFSLVIMFGGIPVRQIVAVTIIVIVTTVAFTALGVFISSIARTGLLASLVTYTIVLALTLGSYAVYLASSPLSKAVSMKYALYFSPLAAIMSALTQTNLQLNSVVGRLFR